MRKIWDIHGGIHPPENKLQSTQTPIATASIPPVLVFPLSQHIGAPAVPVVEVGQKVLKGEMIAEGNGFVSVPIHASTSGEIISIEDRAIAHPSGMSSRCIVLKADNKDEWVTLNSCDDFRTMEKTELLDRIRNAGIAGMGGAGFPSAVKLATTNNTTIDTLIINATECEPYITADDILMRERANEIVGGIQILQHIITPTKETVIGIEDNKPEAIAALQTATQDTNIEIAVFPTKYPSGGEKQLIEILTGKEVPAGGLPADIGIICQNVGTTAAIFQAISEGKPLISRITTVTGNAVETRGNFEVLLGTPVNYLLEQSQLRQDQCSRIIMGGPMMGFTLHDHSVPIVKTTNCLLAPTEDELPLPQPAQACIRCGLCAEACPVSLLPQQMYWFARGKEYEKLEAHNIMDCIECGACSYACPSQIPLVQYYRASKADIREMKQDAIKAEQSKARFEARQERIERQEAEKEAKRKARKAAAEAKAAGRIADGESDPIQAAIERAKAKKEKADPAQQAIEKAKSKRADKSPETPTRDSLEQALAAVDKRLKTAQEKLNQAKQENSDKITAFQTGVDKTQEKYDKAKQALDDFIKKNPDADSSKSKAEPLTGDAAQDAIAKALAKREAASSMSDEQRLENAVSSISKRIEKAKEKVKTGEQEQSEHLEILKESVAKLEGKLEDATQALNEYRENNGTA